MRGGLFWQAKVVVTSLSNVIKGHQVNKGEVAVEELKNREFHGPKPQTSVIKREVLREVLNDGQPVPKPLSKADKMLLHAEQILSNAKRRAEEIEREGYETGFAEGEKAGIELGKQKLGPLINYVDSLVKELTEANQRVINENERDLIKIAFLIASKVVHHEIQHNNEVVVNIAKSALEKTTKAGKVILRINPTDYDYLVEFKSKIPEFADLNDSLEIERDPSVGRGGCIVATNAGEIDGTIENQLRILKDALFDEK